MNNTVDKLSLVIICIMVLTAKFRFSHKFSYTRHKTRTTLTKKCIIDWFQWKMKVESTSKIQLTCLVANYITHVFQFYQYGISINQQAGRYTTNIYYSFILSLINFIVSYFFFRNKQIFLIHKIFILSKKAKSISLFNCILIALGNTCIYLNIQGI